MASFLVKAILAPSGDQAGSESVAGSLVRRVKPVPLDLMMSMWPSKPANAIMSARMQAMSNATDVVTPVETVMERGLVPLTVQFVVPPARATLGLPALSPAMVIVAFTDTARAVPPSMATL